MFIVQSPSAEPERAKIEEFLKILFKKKKWVLNFKNAKTIEEFDIVCTDFLKRNFSHLIKNFFRRGNSKMGLKERLFFYGLKKL